MLCRVATVECLPVHHHNADYIFWSFGIIGFILSYLENSVLLKPVLGGVASAAYFITGLEQTQYNLACYIRFLVYSLLP